MVWFARSENYSGQNHGQMCRGKVRHRCDVIIANTGPVLHTASMHERRWGAGPGVDEKRRRRRQGEAATNNGRHGRLGIIAWHLP
jgi:hypothetical protein